MLLAVSRLDLLLEEIDLIHFANMTYWRQTVHGHASKAGYYRRQDRLEELRGKLADLQTAEGSNRLSRKPYTLAFTRTPSTDVPDNVPPRTRQSN